MSERERDLTIILCTGSRVTVSGTDLNRVGRTTLSEVENDLVPGEDDLSGSVTNKSQL